jgi:hypothetical protein
MLRWFFGGPHEKVRLRGTRPLNRWFSLPLASLHRRPLPSGAVRLEILVERALSSVEALRWHRRARKPTGKLIKELYASPYGAFTMPPYPTPCPPPERRAYNIEGTIIILS